MRLPVFKHQLEALYHVYRFFSTTRSNQHESENEKHQKNVALICLPTGGGKTGVGIMSAYLLAARRVLVITPSVQFQEQWLDEFWYVCMYVC